MPAVPAFRHRVIARELVVVIDPAATIDGPVELEAAAGAVYILGPPTCGLTTFTTEFFRSHDVALRTYLGEAASFRAVDEWAAMGLGAALLPRSKVTRQHASCRPLLQASTPVEIAYEAVWDCDTPPEPTWRNSSPRSRGPGRSFRPRPARRQGASNERRLWLHGAAAAHGARGGHRCGGALQSGGASGHRTGLGGRGTVPSGRSLTGRGRCATASPSGC
ncbi:hypothetical protein B1C81_36605 [Streptomyces sp. HG99]|nr:hypothetical protein B1C81_36605 [Streptomyces sp. HG99]